jgi:hypothetical protein
MRGQAVLQGGSSVPCHYLDVGGSGFDLPSFMRDPTSTFPIWPPTHRSSRPTSYQSLMLANPSQRRTSILSQLYNVTLSGRAARQRLWRRAHLELSTFAPHSVHKLAHKISPRIHKMQAIDAVVWAAGQTTSNVPRNVPSRFAENLVQGSWRDGLRNIFSPLHPVCPLTLSLALFSGPRGPVAASFSCSFVCGAIRVRT